MLLNTYPCFQFIVKSHAIQKWSGNQISITHPLHDKAEGGELAGPIADQLTFKDVRKCLA